MQYINFEQTLSIRPLRNEAEEIRAVAAMQCASYRRQFSDPAGPLGGSLANAFPVLEKYENTDCFLSTWRKLAKITTQPKPDGYAFVAFLNDKNGQTRLA